jgi:hypothetical protein
MAAQLVASRVVLSSTELVSYLVMVRKINSYYSLSGINWMKFALVTCIFLRYELNFIY